MKDNSSPDLDPSDQVMKNHLNGDPAKGYEVCEIHCNGPQVIIRLTDSEQAIRFAHKILQEEK